MASKGAAAASRPSRVRCAIYTRKSSEEGLDQEYNSLHAQRDACEAYVRSQVGEGWAALPAPYDDGGFSGGSMDRPGLRQLLTDIERGLIDVVVVYKVDRLTRSLTDFARIVETFDARGVSFVSVTQAFNTTTSMGRLTLNVLLSFAQFEREVTGERIRDKIAASKAKGMWMGGHAPLGYDRPSPDEPHKLVVNEVEAALVRRIFQRYLELGSVHVLQRELAAAGVCGKTRPTGRDGLIRSAGPLNRGALYHLLRNRTYLGEIVHGDKRHPGLHAPIVARELFEAVAQRLQENTPQQAVKSATPVVAPLRGRLFNAEGAPMSPTVSYSHTGRAYRYYVSSGLQRGGAPGAEAIRRAPAPQLEAFVGETLQRLGGGGDLSAVRRLEVHPQHVRLVLPQKPFLQGPKDAALAKLRTKLRPGEALTLLEDDALELLAPQRLAFRGGRTWMVGADERPLVAGGRADPAVTKALKASHATLAELGVGPFSPTERLREAKSLPHAHQRALSRLAFLAPDVQAAILDGRLPPHLNVGALTAERLPLAWADQRAMLGL
jgi:DNA invertase Pin-like site-specific DNA recombinase